MAKNAISVILPAGGSGSRMKAGCNKQYLLLENMPILTHTWRAFARHVVVSEIILVVAPGEESYCWENVVTPYHQNEEVTFKVTAGGKDRQHSVYNGLCALNRYSEIVAIHDGARPLIDYDVINQVFTTAREHKAVVTAVPVKDTIKQVKTSTDHLEKSKRADKGIVHQTLPREQLVQVQTPQVFHRETIWQAYEMAFNRSVFSTDDSGLVELLGEEIVIVQGDYRNIKITTWEDLILARALIQEQE